MSAELWVFFAHIKGFPYFGLVNITLTIDDALVKEVRKMRSNATLRSPDWSVHIWNSSPLSTQNAVANAESSKP